MAERGPASRSDSKVPMSLRSCSFLIGGKRPHIAFRPCGNHVMPVWGLRFGGSWPHIACTPKPKGNPMSFRSRAQSLAEHGHTSESDPRISNAIPLQGSNCSRLWSHNAFRPNCSPMSFRSRAQGLPMCGSLRSDPMIPSCHCSQGSRFGGACAAGRAETAQEDQWDGQMNRGGKVSVKVKAKRGGARRCVATVTR